MQRLGSPHALPDIGNRQSLNAEARVKKIDGMFCVANYFEQTPRAEIKKSGG